MTGAASSPRCEVLPSPGRVREALRADRAARRIAIDVEVDGARAVDAALVGLGLCSEPGIAYFVPFGRDVSEPDVEGLLRELRTLLGAGGPPKVAHDAKFGLVVLGQRDVEVGRIEFDTLLAAFLLDGKSSRLEELAATRLGADAALMRWTAGRMSMEDLAQRACTRADTVLRLRERLELELEERGQLGYLLELELPLVPVLADMELAGIRVDITALRRLSRDLEGQLRRLETEMEEVAGLPVNPRSPRQLGKLLYEDLGLEGTRKTSSGRYSTDALALAALAGQHPIVEKILEYRRLSRLKDAYVDSLPRLVSPHTGRVHTSFSQVSTSTGRLTSSDPNLQNIPVRTPLGREIRRAFTASDLQDSTVIPGPTVLLSTDYAQIELRVLAHVTGEERLREAFARDEDVHVLTASRLYGVKPEDVTADMRRVGKMLNYGIIYGMTGYRLALETGIERREAVEFVRRHREQYPAVQAFFERTLREAEEKGYVETPSGRRRYLPDLRSRNRQRREAARRAAENMPNQGMVAEIIKRAMISVRARLRERGMKARMLLQVHDELLFEVPEGELNEAAELVVSEMESAVELSVPLKVEAKHGRSWGEMWPLGRSERKGTRF